MKNKLEFTILIVLIIIFSSYIIFRQDKNINYTIPIIQTIKGDELTKIDYQGFELTKSFGEWILPSGYKLSEDSKNRIITALTDLKIIDMISQAKDYDRFGLATENVLTLYNKEGELLKLEIGATSSTGNYTYIKFPDQDSVYSVRGDINQYFTTNEDDLRSKVVLNTEGVTSMDITKDGDTKTLSEAEFKEMQVYLNTLSAESFKDLSRDNLLLSMSFKGDKAKTLNIYEKQGDSYPATSSDVDFPFTLPEYVVNKLKEL